MEEKHLDFNQPILSVRRFSSTVTSEKDGKRRADSSLPKIPPLPSYRSELKSGPIRNPGTVPFVWERSPGRPKAETKSQTQTIEQPPKMPKLPPGRIVKAKQHVPEKLSENLVRHEARKVPSSSHCVPSIEENILKAKSRKDVTKEGESSDSGDGDEAYLDALDTLSRTESFFLNCSMSGLSGLDGPELKPSGTFSTDPQTQDFMMGRFLPAAKAMASETPNYTPWKQPVMREQPEQAKKEMSWDKRPPLYHSRPNVLPYYSEAKREEESDDEDDGYDEPTYLSSKVCGLLPRFCLLNPVPGMSVRTRVPTSPLSRTQAGSSSAGSCQETENKHNKVVTHGPRLMVGSLKAELHEFKNPMRSKSNQVPYKSKTQGLEGSSLYRRLQGRGTSPQENELTQSSSEEKRFLGIPEEAKVDENHGFCSTKRCSNSFQEILADWGPEREQVSASPVVEKTLHVDSVQKVVSPKFNSSSLDKKGLPNSIDKRLGTNETFRGLEKTPSVDSFLEGFRNSHILDVEIMVQPKTLNATDDSSLLAHSRKPDQEMMKDFEQNQDLYQELINSKNLKLPNKMDMDVEDQQQLIAGENVEESQGLESQFPIPPPLPKSPSESWLWRTLPAMSSRKSSSHSHLGTQMNTQHQAFKTPSVDPKWEKIVKIKKELKTIVVSGT